jgi:hypothetical protein
VGGVCSRAVWAQGMGRMIPDPSPASLSGPLPSKHTSSGALPLPGPLASWPWSDVRGGQRSRPSDPPQPRYHPHGCCHRAAPLVLDGPGQIVQGADTDNGGHPPLGLARQPRQRIHLYQSPGLSPVSVPASRVPRGAAPAGRHRHRCKGHAVLHPPWPWLPGLPRGPEQAPSFTEPLPWPTGSPTGPRRPAKWWRTASRRRQPQT